MKIFYTGQQGGQFGWGCFGLNIVREFKRIGSWSDSPFDADCIFQPLCDNDLTPSAPLGRRNFAMSFFEFELGPNAKANADKFETVFVGSTWCQERCQERGILNTRVLIQGVDSEIFKPQLPRRPDGAIHIFSGGKFEYRKGQDIVIEAFRKFLKAHPTAHLACSWWNPWPQLIRGMEESELIHIPEWLPFDEGQVRTYHHILTSNGIPTGSFTVLPPLPQTILAELMADTDFGIFTNRCEGGTNLVLMEYLSCGRPAVANLKTGHADIKGAAIHEIAAGVDENGWAVQTVEDVIDAMEAATAKPLQATSIRWTWEAAARKVLDAATS